MFAPLRVNSPLPEIVNALLPWLDSVESTMFPANVVAPDAGAHGQRRGVRLDGTRLFMMIAPAAPLRLPTGCGFPPRSNTPPAAMVKAVAAGRLSPLAAECQRPAGDHRRTAVAVGAVEGQRAASRLHELPAAADRAAVTARDVSA